jgi:hypothetical protein
MTIFMVLLLSGIDLGAAAHDAVSGFQARFDDDVLHGRCSWIETR